MESSESLLKKALLLKPQDRFLLIDGLIRSLDEPDKEIEEIWSAEAEKRLKAHREGKTQGIPFETVFGEELQE
jgi:putative addiction module component (TIGR02574 family)